MKTVILARAGHAACPLHNDPFVEITATNLKAKWYTISYLLLLSS